MIAEQTLWREARDACKHAALTGAVLLTAGAVDLITRQAIESFDSSYAKTRMLFFTVGTSEMLALRATHEINRIDIRALNVGVFIGQSVACGLLCASWTVPAAFAGGALAGAYTATKLYLERD